MNKVKKIIIFLIMILMVFSVNFSINSYATSCSKIEGQAKAFKTKGEDDCRYQIRPST